MKRWNVSEMLKTGHKLFEKIYRRKAHANHNHDIHFMAREIEDWLPKGIRSMLDGSYDPRCLKRIYFEDETVDQVYLADRILQHILLRQLKSTFSHVMNKNCYHLVGPTGVRYATQRIRQTLQDEKPQYIIRADIKSFYASIPHFKLLNDIKKYYDDPKVQRMLENIIKNPIETPRGYKNSSYGIALRGPLSQFFSGIYLKPLDDAFDNMNVTYLRYQDDIIILCKTKRQLNRCRRRFMAVLHERQLSLSKKKSRIGLIKSGFHFLGIYYPPTQTEGNISVTHANDDLVAKIHAARHLTRVGGGKMSFNHQAHGLVRLVPHPRTLRKAREQVKSMVIDEVSPRRIRAYLHRWVIWWVNATGAFIYEELIKIFCATCFDESMQALALGLLLQKRYEGCSVAVVAA